MTQYYLRSTFISLLSLVPKMFMRIEVLDVVHRLKQHDKYLVVRFLALVTTMVTKVDHGNYGWLPRLVTMVSYLGYQGANYGY